jgi:ABC-type multidrug transport system fused ATPase/permease subunit
VLSFELIEEASYVSQGLKLLLTFAGLVANSPVLILDEAPAP